MGIPSDPEGGNQTPDKQLEIVQSILFAQERARIRELEEFVGAFRKEASNRLEKLVVDARALSQELRQARSELGEQVDSLRQAQNDLDGLIERLTPAIGEMIGQSIHDSRDEMAEALGPIMGEAIRVQIRDSRKEMVDALYPVIGETVQKSLAEFARELQHNIDARLKSTLGVRDTFGILLARLRGVSSAELTLRQSLPFSIKEIFLIQRESGLLLARSNPDTGEARDADLVSGMLTAIRNFVEDSYGQGQQTGELDEIQYGTQQIILVSGTIVYLAVVTTGIEPEGFRARLHDYLSELQVKYGRALRQYNGDPSQIPNLAPQLRAMSQSGEGAQSPKPLSPVQKWGLFGGILICVACLALSCFYLQFTLALIPIAFPPGSTITPSITSTLPPNPTTTATNLPSITPTFTVTSSPLPTLTLTLTNIPTATLQSQTVLPRGDVWVYNTPEFESQPFIAITNKTPVQMLKIEKDWVLVSWQLAGGKTQQGYIPAIWLLTPTPSPSP